MPPEDIESQGIPVKAVFEDSVFFLGMVAPDKLAGDYLAVGNKGDLERYYNKYAHELTKVSDEVVEDVNFFLDNGLIGRRVIARNIEDTGMDAIIQVVVVNNRTYTLIVRAYPDLFEDPQIEHFINSLSFVEEISSEDQYANPDNENIKRRDKSREKIIDLGIWTVSGIVILIAISYKSRKKKRESKNNE